MTRRRWPLVVVAIAISIACVGTLVFLAERSRVSVAPVDAELARLGAAGFPTTWEEALGAASPESARHEAAEDDGARDVAAAFDWLEETFGRVHQWELEGPWSYNEDDEFAHAATPEQMAALASRLTAAQPFFDRVEAGLAKPRFVARPATDRVGLPTRRFGFDRDLLRQLLVARAMAAATEEERVAGVRDAARLSARTESGAFGVNFGWLGARRAAIREARRAAERGTTRATPLLRALDDELAASVLPRLPAGARVELAWLAAAWRTARTSPTYPRAHWGALWVRDVRRALRQTNGHDCSLDHGDPLAEMDAHEAAAALRLCADSAAIDASSPEAFRADADAVATRHAAGAVYWSEGLRYAAKLHLRVEAASRLARVALAAKAHREATGAWPATLDVLAPALGGSVPTDPRTDAPFVYSTDGPKVRLVAPGDLSVEEPTLRDDLLLWEFPK